MNNNNLNLDNYATLMRAAWLDRRDYSVLRLTGDDRVDFLQRMTTNNMARLQPGHAAVTVLTSPTARIQFVFTVLCRADDLLLLPSGPHQVDGLARHLRGQIFFMDNVSVETQPDMTRLRVVGAEAASALQQWQTTAADLKNATFVEQDGILLLRQDDLDLPGYELLVSSADAPAQLDALQAAGIAHSEDDAAYTARRVELGRPAAPAELNEDYSPLEVGLTWTCAENKGCYTGQEIIARQLTYDKVTRTLVGVQTDTPLLIGATVSVEGKNVGTITSAAYSPENNAYRALAVIRRPHNEAGITVTIESESTAPEAGAAVTGQVVELPQVAPDDPAIANIVAART